MFQVTEVTPQFFVTEKKPDITKNLMVSKLERLTSRKRNHLFRISYLRQPMQPAANFENTAFLIITVQGRLVDRMNLMSGFGEISVIC